MKKIITPESALLSSLMVLTACSGDGRPLEEEVEANALRLNTISVVQPPGLLSDLVVNPGTQLTLTMSATNLANLPVTVSSTNRRWSVTNSADTDTGSAVASIDENGVFQALAEGTAVVRVFIGGIASQNFTVTVRDEVLESIENIVGADSDDSMERCLPELYRAVGRFRPVDGLGQGSLRGLPNAEWNVVNSEIGSISTPADGFATATGVNVGTLELVAKFEDIASEPKPITIEDTLREIRIAPATLGLELGDTLQLIAIGRFNNAEIERDAVITESVQWLSDADNGFLSVGNLSTTKGLVSTSAVGNALVRAVCGNLQTERAVAVIAAGSTATTDISFESGTSLTVSIASGSLQLNLSTGSEYSDDDDITDDDDTQWFVQSGDAFVDINNVLAKGLLSPLSVGTATIRATYDGLFQDLTVSVVP